MLVGCYSFSTLQEPQTLSPGGVRGAPKIRLTPQGGAHGERDELTPSFELDLRIGLIERLELQVGGGTSAVGRIGLKALLVDWDALTLAVVPTYQIQRTIEDSDSVMDEEFLPEYRTQALIVPLIAGIPLTSHIDLLLGTDLHAGRRRDTTVDGSQSGGFLAIGAHLGAALHLADRHVTLVPQCGVLRTVASTQTPPSYWEQPENGGYEIDDLRRGNLLWECALGGSFGGRTRSSYAR